MFGFGLGLQWLLKATVLIEMVSSFFYDLGGLCETKLRIEVRKCLEKIKNPALDKPRQDFNKANYLRLT
jgi:hypothetical protein